MWTDQPHWTKHISALLPFTPCSFLLLLLLLLLLLEDAETKVEVEMAVEGGVLDAVEIPLQTNTEMLAQRRLTLH